jgi:sulfite exporter TauE/SafE
LTPEWWTALALTFAASVHCVGMCGGFVLALCARQTRLRAQRWLDAVLLQVGKATTYAFLGTLAGALGEALVGHAPIAWGARGLALLAAVALALAGLTMLGLGGRAGGWLAPALAPLWSRGLGPLLAARPAGASLVVGMAMGLLPCPLVYAGLAAAAASASALGGALTLAGVALGTVPALTLVALFGSTLPLGARQGLARAAGALLLVVALITASRGLGLHGHHVPAADGAAQEHAHHH